MIDWPAIADLTLTGALVVAVVTLWKENQRLVNIILANNERAERQRLELLERQEELASALTIWRSEN